MQRISLVLIFLLSTCAIQAQQEIINGIIHKRDSILNLLSKETDPDKEAKLVTSIYNTSIDGFPLLVIDMGQKLLAMGRERNDLIIESSGWTALAQGYRLTGNYVKALKMHQQGIELAERSGNNNLKSLAYNQMGHIYKDRMENQKAIEIYRKSLLYSSTDNEFGFWFPKMNLGVVYVAMQNIDSALYFLQDALVGSTKTGNQGNQSILLANMGSAYSIIGQQDKAQQYFAEALRICRNFKSPRYLNSCYSIMAEDFNRRHLYDSAAFMNKLAITTVQGTPSAYMSLKPARLLIDYYQDRNPDSAIAYWRIYSAANDSLNSTRNNQQIQMMTFENDQRQWELEQAQKNYKEQLQKYVLLAGLGMLLIVLYIMYRANQRRKKANEELSKAYSNLRSTQQQLIQSEKMASLGELTAGIAHEIQNPLNFVNNFSEINTELTDEISEALDKDDKQTAKELVNDIRENQQRINEHGKRAEAIVRGMLQHSRTGTGNAEPTDINALADEYLRLAFHGFRAKDKSFNASFITEFDPSIGNVNIVPQDIGRVLLNLVNNAFYAVNEKARSAQGTYEPTVTIKTQKKGQQLEIRVSDNGNGIPQNIQQKIFQPFFTTKPTGQGTGLGLSLSYDIVKAHGGELKLESKEGEGSRFTIQLPDRI